MSDGLAADADCADDEFSIEGAAQCSYRQDSVLSSP